MAKKLILVTGATSKLGESLIEIFLDYDDEEYEVIAVDKTDGLYTDHKIDFLNDTRMQYLRSLYPNGFDYIVHCVDCPESKNIYRSCVDVIFSIDKYLISERTKLFVTVSIFGDTDGEKIVQTLATAKLQCSEIQKKKMKKSGGLCKTLNLKGCRHESRDDYKRLANDIESFLGITN